MHPCLGSTAALLGLVLAAGCSDDGLANQSTGQAATATTGMVATEGSGTTDPAPGTTADPNEETGLPPSDSSSVSDTQAPETGSSTSGPEPTSSSDTTSSEPTTGGPSQACPDGCMVEFQCGTRWASEADCVSACEANLDEAAVFSPFCRDAWEALSVCLATLTCEDFATWQDPMMFPYPCSDADTGIAIECEGQ